MSRYLTSAKWSLVWLALLSCAAAVIVSHVEKGAVHTDILELLPEQSRDEMAGRAASTLARSASQRLVFLVGHRDFDTALAGAAGLAAGLTTIEGVAQVTRAFEPADAERLWRFYAGAPDRALSPEQLAAVASDAGQRVADWALARLFSPVGTGDATAIVRDPFFLFAEAMAARFPSFGQFERRSGHLVATRDGIPWVLVGARLENGALEPIRQRLIVEQIDSAIAVLEQQWPTLELRRAGVLFYSEAGTRSAQRDITLIGAGSIAGTMILLWVTFRSLRPLLLVLLSVLTGVAFGAAATLLAFDTIHVFTLVFGAGLIGVAVDYAFHYLTEEQFGTAAGPAEVLAGIAPAMTLGCLTSMAAYGALLFSPFPGLRQVAVFSVAGLAGAFIAVFWVFPRWRGAATGRVVPLFGSWSAAYLAGLQRLGGRNRVMILLGAFVLAAGSISAIRFDDDVRRLQDRPAGLVSEEAFIAGLSGDLPSTSFILVEGAGGDQVLAREEELRGELDRLRAEGRLGSYSAISQWVPSRAFQQRSAEAYRELVRSHLEPLLQAAGFGPDEASEIRARILAQETPELRLDDWLEMPAAEELGGLWLGEHDGRYYSAVLLRGGDDAGELGLVQTRDYFTYYNESARITNIFRAYRNQVTVSVSLAMLLAAAGFSAVLGWRKAARILGVPVLAGCMALGAVYLATGPLSLFSLAALFVVIGVGIDFALFVSLRRGHAVVVMLAVTLSMLTTLLSFGLLSFSSTRAISSFGMTVLCGILFCYLLTPLTARRPEPGHA